MIVWRSGLGGFVGASKRLIKGFFNYAYTVTTESVVVIPDPIPSGNKRSLGFTNTNRGISSSGKNRVLSVTNTGRKLK